MAVATNVSAAAFCPHNGTAHDGTFVCYWTGGPVTRGTLNIFWLCISTLGLCVWSAVHPDIPYPGSPWRRRLTLRAGWLLLGLFMPEMLVLTALGQLRQAITLLKEVERANVLCEFPWWMNLRKSWKPLYVNTVIEQPIWMKALSRCLRPRTPAINTSPSQPDVAGVSTEGQWWMRLLKPLMGGGNEGLSRNLSRHAENVAIALRTWISRNRSTDPEQDVGMNAPQSRPPPAAFAEKTQTVSPVQTPVQIAPLSISRESDSVQEGSSSPIRARGKTSPARARNHPWTLTHSFYAVMGGYYGPHVGDRDRSNDADRLAVYEIFEWVCFDHTFMPDVSADDLHDRSKADGLAKLLLIWQLFAFLANCAARWNQGLPLSLLEITTTSHCLCSLIALVLWWYKPHSVGEATVISQAIVPKTPPRLSLETARDAVFSGVMGTHAMDLPRTLTMFTIAALYGLPHLLGLSVHFLSPIEELLWEIATFAVVGLPLSMCIVLWILEGDGRHWYNLPDVAGPTSVVFTLLLLYLYAACSMFLVGESVRQVFALPEGSFHEPQLARYLPSFS